MPKFKQADWHDVPDELALFRLWWPACLLVLLIVVAVSVNEDYMPKGAARGALFLSLFATGACVLWQPGRIHLKRLKKLAESCTGEERALVRILIVQKGAITGKDHGVLYRSSGNLAFKGRRTEFSISELALDGIPFPEKIDMVKYTVLRIKENGVDLCITDYLYENKPAMGKATEVVDSWREARHQYSPGAVEILPPTAFLPAVRFRTFTVGWKLLILALVVFDMVFWIRNRSLVSITHLATIGIPSLVASAVGAWHSAAQLRLQGKFLRGR